MRHKKKASIYEIMGQEIQERIRKSLAAEKIDINQAVRRIREEKALSGVALCERAGDLDPKTLTALEKGRIRNPSIKTLHAVSRGLGLTVSELFSHAEMGIDRHFYLGSQKGMFQIDFTGAGVKVISFTPFIKEFFCGKFIFAARQSLNETLLKHPRPIFVSTLIGRFEIVVEDRRITLREGENFFFNGILRHTFRNPMQRESVLWMVTAPSFL